MVNEKVFKPYDVRGIYPDELNEDAAKQIAMAYAGLIKPHTVAVGSDVRVSSPSLKKAVIEGLNAQGVDVIDLGVVPTEMVYFAVGSLNLSGGIQVTASHNPAEYNGMVMVRENVDPISSDNGLLQMRDLLREGEILPSKTVGKVEQKDLSEEYLNYLASRVNLSGLPPLKIVANNNFGVTGPLALRLLTKMGLSQLQIVTLNFQPDGSFPKGRPDPLVVENRAEVSELVNQYGADLAVAWDVDGDRCYITDENGQFIEGCHLTAILADHLLKKFKGEKIVYDPRNVWAVEETVRQDGGIPLMNKAGHTFIKDRMRKEKALFGGEMSGHSYFRDFYYSDNGLLPFLYFLEIIKEKKQPVSQIAAPWRNKYFVSGEVNFRVKDLSQALIQVEGKYPNGQVDRTDGLSMTFDTWRFNLRGSNTEPLLRLNVEAKDLSTCQARLAELSELVARIE